MQMSIKAPTVGVGPVPPAAVWFPCAVRGAEVSSLTQHRFLPADSGFSAPSCQCHATTCNPQEGGDYSGWWRYTAARGASWRTSIP